MDVHQEENQKIDKYDRLKRIPNWSQEKLTKAKVAVFGAGALGNEVLKNLALLGVGSIWVVDYDSIELHNLTRSVLFRESDIGRYKAEVVAERVQELNPETQIYPIVGKLEYALGRGLLRNVDIVFGCLDSINARREINERCYFAGVPWVDGGINHQFGNVALFDPRVSDTACYRCKMNKSAWERLNERYSCGYLKDNFKEATIATTIMTSAVVAAYQVEVAVQLILFGDSHLKPGTQLFLPVKQPVGFRTVTFQLNKKNCPDHELIPNDFNTRALPVKIDNTPKQTAQELHLWNEWELELPFDFISRFVCENCGQTDQIRKPIKEVKQSETWCPQCGSHREAVKKFHITADSEDADLPFKDFYLGDREILTYRGTTYQWQVNVELFSVFEEPKN